MENAAKNEGRARTLEERGMDAARRYLEARGYDVIDQEWSPAPGVGGMVASDLGTVVFVEVQTTAEVDAGAPERLETREVQASRERAAMTWMLENEIAAGTEVRFDAIGIIADVATNRALLRHHKGCGSDGTA